jgi:hypothetical protein
MRVTVTAMKFDMQDVALRDEKLIAAEQAINHVVTGQPKEN